MSETLTPQLLYREYTSFLEDETPLRFGQYIYNKYSYEIDNSYNIKDKNKAFQLLYNSLLKED